MSAEVIERPRAGDTDHAVRTCHVWRVRKLESGEKVWMRLCDGETIKPRDWPGHSAASCLEAGHEICALCNLLDS